MTYTLVPVKGTPYEFTFSDAQISYAPGERYLVWNSAIGATTGEPLSLPLDPTYVLWVDEDGRMKDLPWNKTASFLVGVHITGPALLIPKEQYV